MENLTIDESKLYALGVKLHTTPPQNGVEHSGSISLSGKNEKVVHVISAIAELGGVKHQLGIKSIQNEIKQKAMRGDGEVNINTPLEDGRTVMPRIFFETSEDGVMAIITAGGDEKNIFYQDKYEIVRRAINKALEIPSN